MNETFEKTEDGKLKIITPQAPKIEIVTPNQRKLERQYWEEQIEIATKNITGIDKDLAQCEELGIKDTLTINAVNNAIKLK